MAPSLRWDVFCRVVDNFGDAGVCWRLSRVLADEYGLAVTLWIDDLASLARIVPGLDASAFDQPAQGVRVRKITDAPLEDLPPADVVIEGFGCGLPDRYVAAMADAAHPPVWIVLEYLSAEPWIEASHALQSPHPRLPLQRWFWFPGFTEPTGGLLREARLITARDAFRRDRGQADNVWRSIDTVSPPEALRVSLFCYPNPALPALLDAWANGDEFVSCVVPVGVAASALERFLAADLPQVGAPSVRGRLTVATTHFVDQDSFDRRLWAADLNFVRGEDSFVRAQWAARPFVWQPYAQAEEVHLTKMDAFLARFETGLATSTREAQRAFWYAWNAGAADAAAAAWPAFRRAFPALADQGTAWTGELTRHPDLAGGLVRFCENRL